MRFIYLYDLLIQCLSQMNHSNDVVTFPTMDHEELGKSSCCQVCNTDTHFSFVPVE